MFGEGSKKFTNKDRLNILLIKRINFIASGEDSTPKPRKANELMYGHPMTPNQASPSTSMPHNEDFEMGSPPWPRTAASPVFNSPPVVAPQESFRSSSKATVSIIIKRQMCVHCELIIFSYSFQKSDSLAKLYEMDENPERRGFLDRLLGYMDEIRKPVTACPTISKQPLDLYRLYLYVKERGGFMEVSLTN
jgi:AT-rich interactive domain-containing protein 1